MPILIVLLFPFLLMAQEETECPYERMEFSIKWGTWNVISVGNALIEAYDEKLSRSVIIHAYAKSNAFFSLFYPVDSWSITRADMVTREPTALVYQSWQNKHFRYSEITFEKDIIRVHFAKKYTRNAVSGEFKKFLRNENTSVFDFFTALQKVRTMEYQIGDTIALQTFDDVKLGIFTMKIAILRRETIATIFGDKTKCVVINPLLGDYVGVFVKKGPLFVWFTDNDAKIPVRVEVELNVGPVVMELEKYYNGPRRSIK